MNYYILISNGEGEPRLILVTEDTVITVEPGDDVVVMDENGQPVDVSLRPEDEDLVIRFEDGTQATLVDFYENGGNDDAITVSLNPVEPEAEDYEFNSQTGNLPNSGSFTLMRYSNTNFIDFLDGFQDYGIPSLLAGGGGGGGAGNEPNPGDFASETSGTEEIQPPVARADAGVGDAGGAPIYVKVLSNDIDGMGEGIRVFAIGGIGVRSGDSVTLDSGTVVTLLPNGTLSVLPGPNFVELQDGQSGTETFNYTIRDEGGNVSTSRVTITVNGVNDAPEANPDEVSTGEDAAVTVDVLGNDIDPDTVDTLTVTGVSTPPAGLVTINGDNTITFDPNGDFDYLGGGESETVTLTYVISDDSGETATSTVTFVVQGQNDGPVAVNDISDTDEDNSVVIDVVGNDTDVEGDSLTITGVDQPSKGSVSINSSNQLVFDPGDEFESLNVGESETVTFDYTISDGKGGTDTATVTVTINGVDDASVLAPDKADTDEGNPVTIDVLSNDSDVDDNLTITGVSNPPKGSVTNNGTDVTFDPGTDFEDLGEGESETVTFSYTTNTGASETVTVTVTGTNDGPVAVNDAEATDENTTVVIDVVPNDSDVDGDSLTVIGVDPPAVGSVSINGSNQLVYNPGSAFDYLNVGENATVTFDYTISDGNGATDTATVTVTINGVDDASVLAPDTGTTDEGNPVTIDVLGNDSDVDDTLTITGVSTPPKGTVTNNGTDVTFDPGGDFEDLGVGESETITFTYTTNTGASETVTVTVTGTNDGPVAVDDASGTDEDSSVIIDVIGNDMDVDGDSLTITGVDQPSKGSVSVNASNQLVFDPGNEFEALNVGESETVTFDYTITDENGATDTATVTVTINGVDDASILAPDTGTTDEGNPVTIDVLANDSDVDDTLTITGVSTPPKGSVTNNGTDVTFDPGGDFEDLGVGESETITFTYTTNTGASETVTVTVTGTNDGPVAVNDTSSTNENDSVVIDVVPNDLDIDGDSLTVIGVDPPAVGSVSINGSNQLVYNPGSNFDYLNVGESATVTFDYTISDGNGATDTATVTVTINGVDDASVLAPDTATTDEGNSVTIDVLDNDSDVDDSLTITGVSTPPKGSVTNNGTDVTFDPGTDFEDLGVGESETVTFSYTTNTGASETVTVTVTGTNDGPVAVNDGESTDEDTSVVIDVVPNDSDVDGDSLTVIGVDPPAVGSVSINGSNQLVYNPGNNFDYLNDGESATVTFDYTITDENGATDTATVTVTINGVDDASVLAPDTSTIDEGNPVTIDVLANDSDIDDTLTITSVSTPPKGSVTNNGTDVTFDPAGDFEDLGVGDSETVTFTYTTNTGASETVTVTVTGTNDGPVANNDSGVTDEANTVAIASLSNDSDIDGDNLSILGFDQPSQGSVTLNASNQFVFDPGDDFASLNVGESATVTFNYTVSDEHGGTDTATVTVTVTGFDQATDTTPDAIETSENTPVAIDVLANDDDPDTNLAVVSYSQPPVGQGTVSQVANSLVFDPGTDFDYLPAGESATVSFTYTTNTGETENVTVTVIGVDDATVALPDSAVTGENTPIDIDVLANDVDVDTPLTIASVTQPASGSVTNNGSNVTFDPGTDFEYLPVGESATVTFSYTTNTGETENVTVTINGVDDPTITAPDMAATGENSPVDIDVLGNDSDVDNTLVVASVTQPSLGSVTNNGGNVTFDPGTDFDSLAAGESATVTFTYTTNTGNTENVTVTVNGIDDATITTPDAATTTENSTVDIAVLGNDVDVDTTLSITSFTQPPAGQGAVSQVGDSLRFDPGTDFDYLNVGESATVAFTYTTNTGETENVTVTVNGVDDATITNPDSETTTENATVDIAVLGNDSDVDNALSIASVTQPASGTVTHDGTKVTFDPGASFDYLAAGESATVSFTYTTNTGETEDVTVTINGVDDATVTNPDAGSTDEDNSVDIDVLGNDSDVDSSLSIASVTQPSLGSVSNNGTNVTFNPGTDFDSLNAGESATVTFTYTTNTGETENVTVTINGVDDATVTAPDSATTTENATVDISVLGNDSDVDDTLTIASVTQPGSGSVTHDGTNVTFDPGTDFDSLNAGESATVSFTYTTNTGDTENVTVTINGVDDASVTNPDSASTSEDATVDLMVLGNDVDVDDTLSIASVTQPGSGSVTHDGSKVTFDPENNFDYLAVGESATVSFTYTTNTGVTENVTVTVVGVDDATIANPDAAATDADATVDISVLVNDSDPDTALSVASFTQPPAGQGSVSQVGDDLRFDPGTDFNYLATGETEIVNFTYTTNTGETENVTVTVTGVSDPTITNPDSGTTGENTPVDISVLGNDSDVDDVLSIASVTQPASGSVSHDGTNVTFDPGTDFDYLDSGESATVTFTYTTNTGSTENVTVTINGVDDASVTAPDNATTTENATVAIAVLGNDSDVDDTLSIASLTQPASGSVSHDGTNVTFDPETDFDYLDVGESATVTFTYTTNTGNTETVTVTVNGANDTLMASPDNASTDEDTPIVINVLANDQELDDSDRPLSVTSTTSTAKGSVVTDGTTVSFDPGSDFEYLKVGESETVTFSYTVTNQDGDTDVEVVTVTVNGVNDAPDTHADTLHTIEGTGRAINVVQNDQDIEGSQLTVTEINGVALQANVPLALSSGALVTLMEDGRVYFNPNGVYANLEYGETATISFSYTVTDEDGGSSTEDVTVVIDGVDNDVVVAGAYQVLYDQLYEIQLDPVDESISYVPIGDPLPFRFNSIAYNANDGLIYANAQAGDAGLGVNAGDIIQINPFTGQIVGNLGQFTNDEGETIPSYAGGINSDLNVYYVNGPSDSNGNTAYAIDLDTLSVTPIGILPGADFGVDPNTGLIWSINGTEAYSLDPTSGTLTTYSHGGLQINGSPAGGTWGSMFSDGEGNIQVTSNSGYGLYRLDTSTGELIRVGDAPATNSNDATGSLLTALPSAQPFIFLDADGSTGATTTNDAVRVYDPSGSPVSISDSDTRIADLDGNTIASAEIILKNPVAGDQFIIGTLPAGISSTVQMVGGYLVISLTGNASQTDYEDAIKAISFENDGSGAGITDPREISVSLTDVDDVVSNTATSLIFIGTAAGSTVGSLPGQTGDAAYSDSLVVMEDDNDPSTGGATLNLLNNDSDDPASITGVSQPPIGQGTVTNNGDGTVTFQPGDDFQYLSTGETATTTFSYTTNTGDTEVVTVTVHGVDDPITAAPDSASTSEWNPVIIDVLANDSDPDAGDGPLSISALTQPPKGSVSTDGALVTFDPGSDFDSLNDGETEIVTFIYTVTNSRGEVENELVTVTVTGADDPNAAPTVTSTPTSGTVYEAGLASGTGTGPTTTSVSGALALNDTDGDALTVRVDGVDIGVIDGNSGTVLGSVMGEDGNGQITFYGDGSWTYQLLNDAVHDSDDSTYVDSEKEEFSITVFDGLDSSAPVNLTFNIVDDNVVLGTPSPGSVSNSAPAVYRGTLGVTGADSDSASLTDSIAGWDGTNTTFAPTAETSGGETVYYYVDPTDTSVLIAYTDTSGSPTGYDPSNTAQTLVFSLDVDPVANTYEISMSQPIDNFESAVIDFSLLSASGPQSNYRFTDAPSLLAPGDPVPAGETVIFTAYGTQAGAKVNSNASYMGIGNNLINHGEGALAIDVEKSGNAVVIGYNFNGGGSNTSVTWVAYAADDVTVLGSGTFAAPSSSGTFTVEWMGQQLGKVEIEPLNANTKPLRISSIFVDGIENDMPVDLSFPVTVTDQDGDSASTTLNIELNNSVTPIVIDMDGDGAEFDGIEEGIAFDVDNDGEAEQVAWADEDDGVLVFDSNDNGVVDGIDEIALSRYSDDPNATDLDGLRTFDSNGDNMLDANDEEYDSFLVWQDQDGDGAVGEGELHTLADLGIDGLALISDNSPYSAADGDVNVHGEAQVMYSDGTTGILADAEFDYIEIEETEQPLEVIDESGNVISLDESQSGDDAPTEDLLAPAAPADVSHEQIHGDAGAMPETSAEDDAASAGAAMS